MPKKPVIKAVATFKPIWKLKIFPIILIIKIRKPPKIELQSILKIVFKGKIKNLAIKKREITHPK